MRRKKGSAADVITEVFEGDLIKSDEPTKFLLEIANSEWILFFFKFQPNAQAKFEQYG